MRCLGKETIHPNIIAVYNVQLTEKELGYFYWRMKTNRWYERYYQKGMRQVPWEPWMADTIEKLEPIYENL